MLFNAIIHPAEETGYWAEVPEIPGRLMQGETLEALHTNLQEAISVWGQIRQGQNPASVPSISPANCKSPTPANSAKPCSPAWAVPRHSVADY